jgi:hypothetical protein
MTFTERASQSVNNLRVLFDIDITSLQNLWVNAGAGVWYVNANGLYPEVDSELLSGLSVIQDLPNIGSVLVDSTQLVKASTLLECSENVESFYWDGINLYITCPGWGNPYLSKINIGIVTGYSKEGFTPVGGNSYYESRLIGVPSITKARDPLFWGKIQYEGGSVDLNNGDGGLDLFGEQYNVYGNQARVSIGFADQDISEYELLFTGFIESLSINEENVQISFVDKRKQLTKKVLYSCTNLNALTAIEEILFDHYNIPYNGLYYDTTEWELAKTRANNVTINLQEPESAIEIIQNICESTFGIFITKPDGKYSFRIVQAGDPAEHVIYPDDILNYPNATYDPSEVITATLIGYNRDWTTTGSAYTYLNDTSQEDVIFDRYKTYNERKFDTYLPDLLSAQSFSNRILAYAGEIRPNIELEVPIKYWNIEVGQFLEATINRPRATWFGERKFEVIRKVYNLDRNTITLTVKKYGGEIAYRVTTDGSSRVTTNDELRKVGA